MKTQKIAITDLVYFSDCRRQWYLNRQYLPKHPQPHFWIGNLVHKGLQTYYSQGRKLLPALKSMDKFAKVEFAKMKETFQGAWSDFEQEMQDLVDLGVGMVQNYAIFDSEDPLDGDVLGVEERYQIPLYPGITLVGKIDLILKRDTGIWIIDHKTSGSTYDLKGLDVDEQLTGYAYLLHKARVVLPTGLLYNVLIKDLPAEPKELKAGGLSRDKSQKTVYSLYLSKLQEMGADPSDYVDILNTFEAMGWSKFFTRDGSTRNLHEMESFQSRAIRKGEDILEILKDPLRNAYPSPSTFRCGSCPFLGACKAMEDGGDYQEILDAHFLPNTYYS